jgi:putative transcriptional regulator
VVFVVNNDGFVYGVKKIGGTDLIRFRLREMIIDKEFTEGRRITFEEISQGTGIQRTTLSRIAGQRGYNTTTDNIDKLCRYFDCSVDKLMEYVPDEELSGVAEQSVKQ